MYAIFFAHTKRPEYLTKWWKKTTIIPDWWLCSGHSCVRGLYIGAEIKDGNPIFQLQKKWKSALGRQSRCFFHFTPIFRMTQAFFWTISGTGFFYHKMSFLWYTEQATAPRQVQEGGESNMETLASFLLSVMASIVAYYICKGLDRNSKR